MPDLGKQISFAELLETCGRIKLPQLQRDYAQGRENAKQIRDAFLDALHKALLLPADESSLPLNLDFVYGSMETNEGKYFLPLDGQQRLTTLFLLHWYLAWTDEALSTFQSLARNGRHSRFSYAVRPSSTEFFDELVQFIPVEMPEQLASVRRLLENQSWFYLQWRLDPTIQSALTMLDAIHARFASSHGLFSRLLDKVRPPITFQLLPLEHFGLSDDLYIKMNARGKPLTPFETFKARFGNHLEELYSTERRQLGGTAVEVHDFFSRRMDTQWTDFFWSYRTPTSAIFDSAVMNLFWIVAWISVDPDRSAPVGASVARYRNEVGSFTDFLQLSLLGKSFTDNLICLLEAWSEGGGQLKPQLPNIRYFDERAFFKKVSDAPQALQYSEFLLFAAFVAYLRFNETQVKENEFQQWMRVAYNLITNSDIERPDELERALSGLQKLLPHSRQILPYLASTEAGPLGFSREQLQEESLKAALLLAHEGWEPLISEAEEHGYFAGQIGFLLDFSGIREKATQQPVHAWALDEHAKLQQSFQNYLAKAKVTFDGRGLIELPGEPHQWQRSLLAIGNYLVRRGSNYSFLTDSAGNPDSWKRFLQGASSASTGRNHLKGLWDLVELSADIGPQLAKIRDGVVSSLEPWRGAVVSHPEVIAYCGFREVRFMSGFESIYLLRKQQMNGAHAELFTFVLHLELDAETQRERLTPLQLRPYQSVTMTETEPHVALKYESISFFVIFSASRKFRIAVLRTQLEDSPEVEALLSKDFGFIQEETILVRLIARSEIHEFLFKLAEKLAEIKAA